MSLTQYNNMIPKIESLKYKLYYLSDDIPINAQVLEKDSLYGSLSTIGNENQTYMMKISDDIEQFLEQHTSSLSFPSKDESIRYLEAIIISIFENSMHLKFVAQILQYNNEDSFAVDEVSYTLLRLSHDGKKVKLLCEVVELTKDPELILESFSISEDMKFNIGRESSCDENATYMLHIQFPASESSSDASSVLKHFMLLAVRAICENLQYFVRSHNVIYHENNKESMVLKILVPQKWWNADEMDTVTWKEEMIGTINHLIENRTSPDLSQDEKDSLTMIQMVPISVQHLIQYLGENAGCLKQSNISFVISSSNKIDIFLLKD